MMCSTAEVGSSDVERMVKDMLQASPPLPLPSLASAQLQHEPLTACIPHITMLPGTCSKLCSC